MMGYHFAIIDCHSLRHLIYDNFTPSHILVPVYLLVLKVMADHAFCTQTSAGTNPYAQPGGILGV